MRIAVPPGQVSMNPNLTGAASALFTIERATDAERPQIIDLVDRLLKKLEDEPEEFAGLDKSRVLHDLESIGERFTAFLARTLTGESIGVCTLVETFAIYAGGRYGVIDEMYIVPSYRGMGVGRRLIEAVKDHGRRRGWLHVDVTAPPEAKWSRTVKFYESCGFVFTGPKMRWRLG